MRGSCAAGCCPHGAAEGCPPDLPDAPASERVAHLYACQLLSMRIETIRARDTFGAANAESALFALNRCRAGLDAFAARVYRTDSVGTTVRSE